MSIPPVRQRGRAYVYVPVRLLSTYGIALISTLLAMVPGCWLILRNGVEEKVVLSHIIQSTLNAQLFHQSDSINGNLRLQLGRGIPGELFPALLDMRIKDAPDSRTNKPLSIKRECLPQRSVVHSLMKFPIRIQKKVGSTF